MTLHVGPPFQPRGKIWNFLTEMKKLRVTVCFVAWIDYDFGQDPWAMEEMKKVRDLVESKLHGTIAYSKLHNHDVKMQVTFDD